MNDNNPLSEADTADANSAAANSAAPGDAPAALAAAMDRELDNARKYAVERFAQELVGVVDSLEAGINAGTASSGSALLEGSTATLKQLLRAFDKAGIKVIDPLGQPFDPAWHEAMVAQASGDKPANTVLSVIQKGYSLNGRLLRPARVVVSKASGGDTN